MGDLPWRDIWLLPLIAILTVLGLLTGAEVAARFVWPEQVVNACDGPDPVLGHRYRANCVSTMKTPEGPWYTNTYNDCGYRSDTPCGPLPAGNRRIAVIGSSLSEGYLVEYPNTIAARLGADLTTMCGAKVDVQNLGALGYFGDRLLLRMNEALRLRPDAVILVLAPFDLESALAGNPTAAPSNASFQKRLFEKLKESRALAVAQHFLFRNPSIYLPLYLRYGDKADFLRPPFSDRWQARLQVLERLVDGISDMAHRANVAFMLAFVPQEAQVGLMAGRAIPVGVEPKALQAAIAAIAARHGAAFADTSQALRTQPAPERLYYQVDGHLTGEGQPIAAAYIALRLAAEPDGPFGDCRAAQSAKLEAHP